MDHQGRGEGNTGGEGLRKLQRCVDRAEAAHGEPRDHGVLPVQAVAEGVADILRQFFPDEGGIVPALVSAVQIEGVARGGHEDREIILLGHFLGHAAVEPVRVGSGQAVQQDQRLGGPVIVPGIPDFFHDEVIGKHETEVCVLHNAVCVKFHSSACHRFPSVNKDYRNSIASFFPFRHLNLRPHRDILCQQEPKTKENPDEHLYLYTEICLLP